MTKYYLCIQDTTILSEQVLSSNQFVNQIFYNTYTYNNYYLGTSATPHTIYDGFVKLLKGHIYPTASFDSKQIICENQVTVDVEEVKGYVLEFDLKIDDDVKKIIANKLDDKIEITPISMLNDNNTIIYRITVETKNQTGFSHSESTISSSQYEGVTKCYKRIRYQTSLCHALNQCIHYRIMTCRPLFKKR